MPMAVPAARPAAIPAKPPAAIQFRSCSARPWDVMSQLVYLFRFALERDYSRFLLFFPSAEKCVAEILLVPL